MAEGESLKEGGETVNPKEIERKFWVHTIDVDSLQSFDHVDISQGYMVVGSDGSEARLRDKGGKFTMTVKSGGDLVRDEFETELTKEQFAALWPSTIGKRVEKTRYNMPVDGYLLELDIYSGSLYGLKIVEVEFPDTVTAANFELPEWIVGEEVTKHGGFKNQSLAFRGWPGGGAIS